MSSCAGAAAPPPTARAAGESPAAPDRSTRRGRWPARRAESGAPARGWAPAASPKQQGCAVAGAAPSTSRGPRETPDRASRRLVEHHHRQPAEPPRLATQEVAQPARACRWRCRPHGAGRGDRSLSRGPPGERSQAPAVAASSQASSSRTCTASSRVGTTTTPCLSRFAAGAGRRGQQGLGQRRAEGDGLARPVGDETSRSRPARGRRQIAVWTGMAVCSTLRQGAPPASGGQEGLKATGETSGAGGLTQDGRGRKGKAPWGLLRAARAHEGPSPPCAEAAGGEDAPPGYARGQSRAATPSSSTAVVSDSCMPGTYHWRARRGGRRRRRLSRAWTGLRAGALDSASAVRVASAFTSLATTANAARPRRRAPSRSVRSWAALVRAAISSMARGDPWRGVSAEDARWP